MRRYRVLALLVLAAACSRGETLGAATRQQADRACAEAALALEQVAWPSDDELSLLAVAPAIGATADIQRGLADRLADLSTGAPEDAGLAELVAAGQPLIAALDRMESASAAGDVATFDAALAAVTASTEQAAAVSGRLGLGTCYVPLDAA